MARDDECSHCHEKLQKCGVCGGRGGGSFLGPKECTECGGSGKVCPSHGKRY